MVTGEKGFKIALSTDGTYSLWVDGNKWLSSGDTFFMSQGRKYSMSDDSLKVSAKKKCLKKLLQNSLSGNSPHSILTFNLTRNPT